MIPPDPKPVFFSRLGQHCLVKSLNNVCFRSATIRPVIEDIVNKFQTCVELSELEFTDVYISNHVFGPQDLKRVFAELSAYNGHYCGKYKVVVCIRVTH